MTTDNRGAAYLSSRAVTGIDTALLRRMRTLGHGPAAERAVLAFTRLGEHGGVWFALAAAGAALDEDRRDVFSRAAVAHALARVWPAAPLYAGAAAMALSRPYMGVHYPSDIVAGAVLGTAVAE